MMMSAPFRAHVVLKALADPLRLRIAGLLAHEAMCTVHIVDATGAGQSNVSNHLRVLRDAGLVDSFRDGRYAFHRLRPDAMEEAAGFLTGLAGEAAGTVARDRRRAL